MPKPAFQIIFWISTGRVSIISFLFPPCTQSSQSFIGLVRILSQHMLFKLGLVLHPTLWGHWILPTHSLVLGLHVLLIGHLLLLFGRHVLWLHATSAARHARLWGWNLRVIYVLRGVDGGIGVNAVLIAWCRLGRIKARLLRPMSTDGTRD